MVSNAPKRGLSKSRVVAGSQCEKLLWWRVHEPDAPELSPDRIHQALFDSGHRVGAAAQLCFAGGTEIAHSSRLSEMVQATQAAMDTDCPAIFEAAFVHEGVFVAVDVLERTPQGWVLIEVKSTKSVKDHHILDAAVQLHVARGSGVDVARVELMHLSKHSTGPSLDGLFARSDITEAVKKLLPALPETIERLGDVLTGPVPEVEPGHHCRQPRSCLFLERCSPPPALDATARLYRIPKRELEKLHALGHTTVHTIPESYPLRPIAARQRRALIENRLIVEPGLSGMLDAIQLPAAYIDFESIGPAIPPFEGSSPYAHLPVQVSVHRVEVDGTTTHHAWLAQPLEDPRPGLAMAVLEACAGTRTLVAYSAGFEKQMIRALAAAVSEPHRGELQALCGRFVDLLPIMRGYVYHPDFGGRFGLKSVTGALLPALAYDDLNVRAGGDAGALLADLVLRGEPEDPDEQTSLRSDLLAYCERDTQTMLELVEVLRAATRSEEPEQ